MWKVVGYVAKYIIFCSFLTTLVFIVPELVAYIKYEHTSALEVLLILHLVSYFISIFMIGIFEKGLLEIVRDSTAKKIEIKNMDIELIRLEKLKIVKQIG